MKRRTIVWGALGILLLGSVVFGARLYQRWSSTCLFGRVVSVSATSLTIETRDSQRQEIRLPEEVLVKRRGQKIDQETLLDERVLVIVHPAEDGVLEARIIRFIHSPLRDAL